MRRVVLPLVGLGCFLGLLLAVYRPVLLDDRQFAWDNASYFYYPLYLRVQQEWQAGRWPLWDPGQNGGEPMLGDPVTAVLYPGKVLFALPSYAWGARLYVIAHTIIAVFGLLALGRSCGVSGVGSFLGGLSYAFGAPVLFNYCNVIFLVGAAWVPWGLCAIDRLLRGRGRWGTAGLAAVLALQVLGGDPEAAYLTALCGAGYAVVLAVGPRVNPRDWLTWPKVLGAVGLWVAATLGLAAARIVRPGSSPSNRVILAAWAIVGIGIAWRWYRRRGEGCLAPLLARLAGACALAAALAAVQILPALEFARQSWRASGVSTALYSYSLDPCRVVELIWPGVFGTASLENRSWLQGLPPVGGHDVWVASIYLGGATLALALSVIGWRSGTPWRTWLTTVVAIALLGSFGKYGSPLWWARWGPFTAALGPHDPGSGQPRPDPFPGDGAGSPYGLLAILLPGFGTFRYPSKLLPFAAVGLATLAGAGWDRMMEAAETRRLRRIALAGLGASLVGLALSLAGRARAIAFLASRVPPETTFGAVDIAGGWAETQRALAHGAVVSAAVLALARWAPGRPRAAGALGLLLLAVDLAAANARLIWTVPQAEFDAPSEAARQIEAAELADPSPGPFRIHRMTGSYPIHFSTAAAADRFRGMIAWARETLFPLHALPLGLAYCATTGPLGLDDYEAFFRPQIMPLPAETARVLGAPPGRPVVYHPRRSFDMWGARYFLLPAVPDWGSLGRGYASFLNQTDLIYPAPGVLYDRKTEDGREPWGIRQDWQLRRNRAAYPRAWIVHYARISPPAADPDARAGLMGILAFMNDPIWTDRDRPVFDLRQAALIETDDRAALRGFSSRTPVGPSESVSVAKYEPQRVELKAALERPGLIILADTYYPGWRLTIDGRPAPIFRANRMMRAAAVPTGEHTLVYTYEPDSVRVGAIVSAAGGVLLLALAWSARRSLCASRLRRERADGSQGDE